MKKALMIMLLGACCQVGFAQEDSTKTKTTENDTIRVGSIIIIKKGGDQYETQKDKPYDYKRKYNKKKSNISTNWLIVDIGYAGFDDKTNYAGAEAQAFLQNPNGIPLNSGDFSMKGFRISNFNLWFFMQKMNVYKHVVNLKYGLGLETNNYYFKTPISLIDGANPYVIRDNVSFSKNKLAADYLTVPLMLNFNTSPKTRHGGLQVSVGVSAGVLYSSRQKQESSERGKQKQKTNFNLEPWKIAYIGELGLGPVKLYGSYATTPLHKYGVEHHPYTVGLRLSTF
jgi:hypothetical protein